MYREAILSELRGIRDVFGGTHSMNNVPAAPSMPKASPRTRAAIRKVQERSAKARGKEIIPTPEQIDAQHLKRLRVRLKGHLNGLNDGGSLTQYRYSCVYRHTC